MLQPVAETKLLMEGLNQPNYRGLERLLRQRPMDTEGWSFIRGQALIIAETGNLLLLRPPHNAGKDAWTERSTALRSAAARLAKAASARDYERCRSGLFEVANVCNRCHQTFRVPVQMVPFEEPSGRKAVP